MTVPKKEFDGLVSINGTKLYVETAGKGEALLLIHAGIGDSRMWNEQYDEFSKTYYVIRCDLRGFGQSKMSSGTFAHHKDYEYGKSTQQKIYHSPLRGIGNISGHNWRLKCDFFDPKAVC